MKRKMAMGLRNRPENAGRAHAIDQEDSSPSLESRGGRKKGKKEKPPQARTFRQHSIKERRGHERKRQKQQKHTSNIINPIINNDIHASLLVLEVGNLGLGESFRHFDVGCV